MYISKSRINGQGLFAGQSFHKGDIIIDNLFPHKDIHKTALGATETIVWEYRENIEELVQELSLQGIAICTIEQAEKTLFLQNISELREDKFALIFGNEVNGVKQTIVDRSNYVIEIPQFGTKHSLNVSVCAGIVLWEFCKKYL